MAHVVDAKAIVNGMAGLMATGGSTNHALHIVAIARAAGLLVDWDDLSDVSSVVPLLARVYPNGSADVNHFAAAGGMGFLIGTMLDHGLLHGDVQTVWGPGLDRYRIELGLEKGAIVRRPAPAQSYDEAVLRPASNPFQRTGGLRLLAGNLGRSVIKTSAVDPSRHTVEAPARVFDSQEALQAAFKAGASPATSSRWCASRALAPMACPSAPPHARAVHPADRGRGPGHRRADVVASGNFRRPSMCRPVCCAPWQVRDGDLLGSTP